MQLVVGGEVLPLALARRLAGNRRALWNQYGPTETAICATRARSDVDVEKITIGLPLPNVRVYLLDRSLSQYFGVPLARYTLADRVWVSVTSINSSVAARAFFPTLLLRTHKLGCTRAAILQ